MYTNDWEREQAAPDRQQERFRGSSEIPLTGAGIEKARQTGIKMAQHGGLDEIHTSSLGRAVHTAKLISQFTHAPITSITDGLGPWHLGYLEGQPITQEHLALQNHLVRDNPDEALPGRGPLSTADGESFNDFKQRTLDTLKGIISKSATDPRRKIGVVTHYRVKKLLDAWMRKGMDPDGSIDSDEMIRHDAGNNPGGVDRLSMDPYAGSQMSSVDLNAPGRLMGGIYIIRHDQTPWNSPDTKSGS